MRKAFVICMLTGMVSSLFVPKGTALTAKEIIKVLRMREESLKTLKGQSELETNFYKTEREPTRTKALYKWIKKGEMEKLTEQYISSPRNITQISKGGKVITRPSPKRRVIFFDGEIMKRYTPEFKHCLITAESPIQSPMPDSIPADWFLIRFGTKPLSVFLEEDADAVYAGTEKLHGEVCHLLKFSKGQGEWYELYLSDKKGLAPIRLQGWRKNLPVPYDVKTVKTFSRFRNYGDIWLPCKVVSTIYYVYPDREEVATKKILLVRDLEVNIEIPQDDIILRLPSGTHVQNTILKINYAVP